MAYVPDRGHVVSLSFDPQAGHEQACRRPALVLSPRSYNDRVGLALLCPITRSIKGYPFEVVLPDPSEVEGVVLADQVRSLDWRARRAEFSSQAPAGVVSEVLGKIQALLAP